MHVWKGLSDYLIYAFTYAPHHIMKGKCWHLIGSRGGCVGGCCCCDMAVLSGDHPFECEYCGSCFRDDGTLRGHKRIHTGEKPYECNGCGKRFSLKHQLETHYRVHTGKSHTTIPVNHSSIVAPIMQLLPESDQTCSETSFCSGLFWLANISLETEDKRIHPFII